MTRTQLHIAMLDCDTPVPNVYAERGLYSDIFAALLRAAAEKTPDLPDVDLQLSKYDCVLGHLPLEEELLQINKYCGYRWIGFFFFFQLLQDNGSDQHPHSCLRIRFCFLDHIS